MRTSPEEADVAAPLRSKRIPPKEPLPAPGSGRRAGVIIAAILLSLLAGGALAGLPPFLVIGFVAAVLVVIAVLARPFWGLLLYTTIFLLRPAELYPVLVPLHLERVVGLVALASLFLSQHLRDRRLSIDRSPQTVLLLIFLVPVLLSVPFAYWPSQALAGLIEILKIVVFYVLVVHLVDSRKRLRVLVHMICILVAYIAATAYLGYVQGGAEFAQGIDRAVGETSAANNPNSLGTTLAATIPFFLLFVFHRPLGWHRTLFAAGAGLLFVTMAVTGSRASILGFLGGMVCLWWISRRRFLVGVVGFFLLAAGFLLLPEQYRTRYSTITQSERDASSQLRLATWKAGRQMIIDRPLTGVGISCFGTAHAIDYSPESKRSWLRAHSLYVQVPAEVGLIGALVFFAFLLEFLRTNRRTVRLLRRSGGDWNFERVLLNALFAGCMVLLISGVFGHSLLRRTWYLYAGLGLSVLRLYRQDLLLPQPAGLGAATAEGEGQPLLGSETEEARLSPRWDRSDP